MSRRSWLLAGLALPLVRAQAADGLPVPLFDGDNLQPVMPPNFHFLSGRPAERLKGGAELRFVANISLLTDDRHTIVKYGQMQPFIISQDIWNEHFKVTIPNLSPHDKIGLTAAQAESWCLENVFISAADVPKDQPLWMRFTMRTVNKDDLSRVMGDRGISVLSLMEYFSRRQGAGESQWNFETPHSFRLIDLPRMLFGRQPRLG